MKQSHEQVRCREFWESWRHSPELRPWSEADVLLDQYAELLLEASKQRNLLSASQRNTAALWGHFYDSIQAAGMIAGSDAELVLDAGSGGGLPGVPLAIALPGQSFMLVDRVTPKAEFLELVVAKCGLRNVTVKSADLTEPMIAAVQPDLVLMRAVVNADAKALPRWLRSLQHAWIVHATLQNQSQWEALATRADFALQERHEYADVSGERTRVLLKFIKL